jgi:hypothetical protein
LTLSDPALEQAPPGPSIGITVGGGCADARVGRASRPDAVSETSNYRKFSAHTVDLQLKNGLKFMP